MATCATALFCAIFGRWMLVWYHDTKLTRKKRLQFHSILCLLVVNVFIACNYVGINELWTKIKMSMCLHPMAAFIIWDNHLVMDAMYTWYIMPEDFIFGSMKLIVDFVLVFWITSKILTEYL